MKPTFENLDQWLFDSLEGNLSPEQQAQLDSFLDNHPELSLEQEAWETTKFDAAPITYEPKSELYRQKRFAKLHYYAAAIILLLILGGSYFLRPRNSIPFENNPEQIAKLKSSIPQIKTVHLNSNNNLKPLDNINANNPLSNHRRNIELLTSNTLLSNKELFLKDEKSNLQTHVQAIHTLKPAFPRLIDGYRTNLQFEHLSGIALENNGNKKLRLPNLQKLNNFAQKELGLTNNQSYDLLLPAKSAIDANLSSVGSKSQTRFQTLSLGRSGINHQQALLGQQFSLDGYSRNLRAGFGLQGKYMQHGGAAICDYEIGLIASPKLLISRHVIIEPAARLRMGSREVNAEKLSNLDFIEFQNADVREVNFDSTQGIGRRLLYRDLDLGFAIQTPILFASAQIENVFKHFDYVMGNQLQPKNSRASHLITVALGTQFASRNEKMRFSPYFLYTQNPLNSQFHAGMQLNINKWQFGLNVAQNNLYQASIGYVGKNAALLLQSCQQQLLSMNTPSYLHQISLRIYSQQSRQARHYIKI